MYIIIWHYGCFSLKMLKSNRNIYLLLFILVSSSLFGQYKYEWNDYYDNKSMEEVASIAKTYDGNLILAGTANRKTTKMWLVKINHNGENLWTKEFTNFTSIQPIKIIESYDKNYIISSIIIEKNSIAHKIWLTKVNQKGRIIWERLYSGLGDAYCSDIVETEDKGIVISGYSSINADEIPDWYILKVDSLGYKKWDKSFGTKNDDRALAVDEMYDGSLVFAGYISYTFGGYKRGTIVHLSKTGADLDYNELKTSYWSTANDIVCTSDSAYVITAEIKKQDLLDFDIQIIKMTIDGKTIWEQNLNSIDMAHPVSIIETFDQGYAIAYTEKKDGVFNSNVSVLKLSPQGEIAWQKVFIRESDDFVAEIIEGADNSLMVAATNYNRDIGWNYGVLKYTSIEMSDMHFIAPENDILTVYNSKLDINAYITGYKRPLNLKIFINNKLYTNINSFAVKMGETNKYLLNNQIDLINGKNTIDFVVTDYKKFQFTKTLIVYYLPEPTPIW